MGMTVTPVVVELQAEGPVPEAGAGGEMSPV